MGSPDTRPSEMARIAKLAGGDPTEYRTEVLLLLIENREAYKRHEQWQSSHEKLDDERHDGIIDSIAEMKRNLGGAVSGVNNYKIDRVKFDTVKVVLASILGAIVTILGLAIAGGYIGR